MSQVCGGGREFIFYPEKAPRPPLVLLEGFLGWLETLRRGAWHIQCSGTACGCHVAQLLPVQQNSLEVFDGEGATNSLKPVCFYLQAQELGEEEKDQSKASAEQREGREAAERYGTNTGTGEAWAAPAPAALPALPSLHLSSCALYSTPSLSQGLPH